MKKKDNCPICNNILNKDILYINKCLSCKLLKSKIKPAFGQSVHGIKEVRKKNFSKIISLIVKYQKKPKILEVGSGSGYFLDLCKKKKLKFYSIEPYKKDYKILKKKYPKVFNLSFPLKSKKKINNKFSVIIFNDVFEHIQNINEAISQSKYLLKKNGLLILNLPNSDGLIYRSSRFFANFGFKSLLDRQWHKNFASPHQFFFNNSNLDMLVCKKFKFKKIFSDYLLFITKDGLKERIKSTYMNFLIVNILFCVGCVYYYLQSFISKDIILKIYKK